MHRVLRTRLRGYKIVVKPGQGHTVPSEQVPTLFNRYSRGAHLSDISGAGLGLYLVARIARWHGGEVSYDTMNTGGACFRILLPTPPHFWNPQPR